MVNRVVVGAGYGLKDWLAQRRLAFAPHQSGLFREMLQPLYHHA